ncbi:MAG TPA: nuclear transport factor 2 family protein [Acidimicrobiales bacterium]|nr:nuclear transport factor 2 family protein [Acidimicrobiales bacterium]
MAHPNAEVLRRADEAMERGDIEGFFSHYSDDVVVHVAGSNRLAGDYKGLDQLQEVFRRFIEAMGEYTSRTTPTSPPTSTESSFNAHVRTRRRDPRVQ